MNYRYKKDDEIVDVNSREYKIDLNAKRLYYENVVTNSPRSDEDYESYIKRMGSFVGCVSYLPEDNKYNIRNLILQQQQSIRQNFFNPTIAQDDNVIENNVTNTTSTLTTGISNDETALETNNNSEENFDQSEPLNQVDQSEPSGSSRSSEPSESTLTSEPSEPTVTSEPSEHVDQSEQVGNVEQVESPKLNVQEDTHQLTSKDDNSNIIVSGKKRNFTECYPDESVTSNKSHATDYENGSE